MFDRIDCGISFFSRTVTYADNTSEPIEACSLIGI